MADWVAFVSGLQGPYGLWEYTARPQASRWVTFDLLRSLSRLDEGDGRRSGDWLSFEPPRKLLSYLI